MATRAWFRRFLAICPALIALLWVAGIARFHDLDVAPIEWGALAAIAFALHLIGRRARRRQPLPRLPADANPVALSGFAAAIVGVVIGVLGGLLEWFVAAYRPSPVALPLRALWHAACAFAAAYCGFLLRLQLAAEAPPNADRPGGAS